HVMIFCPTDKANHLEHLIRQDFMELYEQRFPASNDESNDAAFN
ncbi:mechanosensitive ion channel family protein, partial [Vibrio sp. 1288]|nr:mechanosensitive ion channel family protein [Vibrio sp. 1288]